MYEDYPEIPVEDLIVCAERDIARGIPLGKYILCLRCNSTSIYNNIYLAAIVIDYQAAASQQDHLLDTLRSLSDKDGFHEDSSVPSFIVLNVFSPYESGGKIRHGGPLGGSTSISST